MPFYLPDISEIMAVAETRGEDSDAPHLWRGLVGAWPLQETGGSTAFDVSGYGRNGVSSGTAIPGRRVSTIGRASDFDAIDDKYLTTFAKPLNDLTVSLWFRSTYASSNSPRLVDANYETGFYLGLRSTTNNTIWGGGIIYPSAPYGQDIILSPAGEWHHLGIHRSGDQHTVFGDGGKVTNVRTGPTTATGTTPMRIGGGGVKPCDADIALVHVWDRSLSLAEIQQLYDDPWAMYRLRVHPFPVAVAASGITETPAAVSVSWSVAAPTLAKAITPDAVSATFTAVTPATAKAIAPAAVAATWTPVTPATSKTVAVDAVSATWSIPTPTAGTSFIAVDVSPITATWLPVAPSTAKTIAPDPIAATWSPATPATSKTLAVDPLAVTWSIVAAELLKTTTPDPVAVAWLLPDITTAGGAGSVAFVDPVLATWTVAVARGGVKPVIDSANVLLVQSESRVLRVQSESRILQVQ